MLPLSWRLFWSRLKIRTWQSSKFGHIEICFNSFQSQSHICPRVQRWKAFAMWCSDGFCDCCFSCLLRQGENTWNLFFLFRDAPRGCYKINNIFSRISFLISWFKMLLKLTSWQCLKIIIYYFQDFNDIRQDFLPWKTLKNIIEYYYMWKTTDRYVQQKRVKAVEAESKLKQVYIPN